ncbi:MAG: transcription termination/antitermination factor NusG [Elusimicrobia bacterium RIFCSPLOWO2_01_FULL_59_12]|nr:MAG: transcription termination/antitermination factor NusG [Elusimicrobia bacterium RIFCSPLOWO2_01_FULL_59_12]
MSESQTVTDRGWYVIHTYSGHEDRVKASLEKTIENLGLQSKIHKILIPTEEVMEIKRNRKQVKKRKFFPGYVMVDMSVDNETYWTIRNTPGVTGFLGGTKPIPLPEAEIKNLLELATTAPAAKPRPAVTFDKEEGVRIIDGPFRHFIGVVEEVNEERGKMKVMVSIFGRPTPVELDFLQVEKL